MIDEDYESKRLNLMECDELFARLFPTGPMGGDVLLELAPDGWENSQLMQVAHPTPQTLFEEATRLHNNIEQLCRIRKTDDEPPSPAPTLEEIVKSYAPTPVEASAECADIVGRCLWDIFSDNHDVLAPAGRMADIGSFRGAGGFIADWMTCSLPDKRYDYMDFYMGTVWIHGRADLSPVYRMIFRRLKSLGYDWKYSFPRIGVVHFGTPAESAPPDGAGYDPSAAIEKEQTEAKRQKEFEEMQASLRSSYNESVRESRTLPPPEIVKAYMSIYGRSPEGWPPEVDEGE